MCASNPPLQRPPPPLLGLPDPLFSFVRKAPTTGAFFIIGGPFHA
jgi:hypothetical protein